MRFESLFEVVALDHPRQRVFRGQLDHARRSELTEPFVVEADLGFLRIEDLEHLPLVRLRVREDFLVRQRRARDFLAGRIADHSGEVADDEDDAMSELLKMLHLPDDDGVSEMQVWRS